MKNFLVYPCKVMRITQSYTGTTSHLPHTTGSPKSYPIDEGCSNSGREGFYCPCDEVVIKRIYGVGTSGTNTIWIESTSKVDFADGTKDYTCGKIIHSNDSDIKDLKVGQKFKRGQLICYEGTDGATGNHFHLSFGKGKFKGNGWVKNSKGKYCLTCTNGAYKPEQLFYIDPNFTKIVNSKELKFKELPPNYTKGIYIVNTEELRVRKGAGISKDIILYSKFTANAKEQIKKIKGSKYKESYFVKGMEIEITKIKDNWGKCKTGWVCLDYCKRKK